MKETETDDIKAEQNYIDKVFSENLDEIIKQTFIKCSQQNIHLIVDGELFHCSKENTKLVNEIMLETYNEIMNKALNK